MLFERENGKAHYMCGKSFAQSRIDESALYVFSSPAEKELIVSVRFGCLRDYLNQIYNAEKKFLVELRQRLETRLDDHEPADKWIEEKFSKFTIPDVYHLLYRFYP